MLTKYATFDQAEVLAVKGASSRQHHASLERLADYENYRTGDGYLYVRIRAISSRVNKNHDSWPSIELAGSREIFEHRHGAGGFTVEATEGNPEFGFRTFVGKPIFVDHHNSNPKKARGVIVDAKLNVLDQKTASLDPYWGGHDVDPEHLPPTEVELLLEVDAKSFPHLAHAIVSGDLDGFSMGADVEKSKCSHCGHIATSPDEFCSHIVMKGAHHDYKSSDGKKVSKKSFEHCYGVKFFEISAVFDPADETALAREVRAAVEKEGIATGPVVTPEGDPGYGIKTDPLRDQGEMDIENHAMQLMQQFGYDPDEAIALAQEYHQRHNPLPGHGEGGSIEDVSTRPPSLTSPRPEVMQAPMHNDPRWSSHKTAENPLPQEMMTRAPDELDTLRDEQLCPVCGSDMKDETCQVCGYVKPPKEFDNPDLSQAEQIRQQMKQQEEQQSQPQQGVPQQGEQLGEVNQPGKPITSEMPRKAPQTAKVKSDMRWTPKVHPKTAARINQVERPITPSNPPQTDEPRTETVIRDQTRPVTSAMATAQQLMANAKHNHGELMSQTRTADGPTPPGDTSPMQRVDVTGVGGVDHATNEEASKTNATQGVHDPSGYAQVDVTGIGGVPVNDTAEMKHESLPTAGRESDDAGYNTDKNIESIPTKTYDDKDGEHPGVGEPVTNETLESQDQQGGSKGPVSHVRQAYDDSILEKEQEGDDPIAQGGSAVQGVQPIDSVATPSYKRVNVLEHETSPENNSGPTKTWTGTDGNGVLKQQDPTTNEKMEWGGVPTPDVQLHTTGRVSIAALRLAEAEVELGLLDRTAKWNRMAELDTLHPAVIDAKLEALSQVKTAGLNKLAAHRTSGVTKLPRNFQRIATGAEQTEKAPISDESLDAGLFLK